jgi:hypothetical protein
LKYQSGKSPTWGLHVQRYIRRERNEQISWMPLLRNRSSLLDQAGRLGAFTEVGEGRPLEMIPTSIITQAGSAGQDRFVEGKAGLEPGLTVSLGITPTMSALSRRTPTLHRSKRTSSC